MSEDGDRRARRAAAQEVFDVLAADYADLPGVGRARMFGSNGLRVGDRFFAFVGSDGELIVKLPAERAGALVDAGEASQVRIGRNPAREWVDLPRPAGHEVPEQWRDVLREAHRYAVQNAADPPSGHRAAPEQKRGR